MRRAVLIILLAIIVGGCSREREYGEFEGQGRIQGSFRLGQQTLDSGWVELIELTAPPGERCGPADCRASMEAFRAGDIHLKPGRWRVVPPIVKGWIRPDPIEVVVEENRVTTIEGQYERDIGSPSG